MDMKLLLRVCVGLSMVLMVLTASASAKPASRQSHKPPSSQESRDDGTSSKSKPLQGKVEYSEVSAWSGRWSGTVKIDSVKSTPQRAISDPLRAGLEARYLKPGKPGKLQVEFAASGTGVKLLPTRVLVQGDENEEFMRMRAEHDVREHKIRTEMDDFDRQLEKGRVQTAESLKRQIREQEETLLRIGTSVSQHSDCGGCP